jgi:hypothetical protein
MAIDNINVKTAFDDLIPHSQLRKLVLENCDGITQLNLHSSNNIAALTLKLPSLQKLSLKNTVAPIFDFIWDNPDYTGLDLGELRELTYLNLNSTGGTGTPESFGLIRLPREAKIETLHISSSTIKTIAVTGNEVAEGLYDFSSISNLKTLTISQNKAVNRIKQLTYRTTSGSTFSGCSGLVSFDADSRITIGNNCAGSTFSSCSALEEIPDHVLSFESQSGLTGNSFFYSCGRLSADTLARIAKALVLADCPDFTFYAYGNTQLTSIPYDFFGTNSTKLSQVKILNSCFRSCTSLTTIEVTPATEEASAPLVHAFTSMTGVESVNALFSYCDKLEFVPATIFSGMTQLKTAAFTFNSCKKLGSNDNNKDKCILSSYEVNDGINTYNSHVFNSVAPVQSIESMFRDCENLEINDGLEGFFADLQETSTLTRGSLAFYGCTKLTHLAENILEGLTSLTNIDGMFAKTMSAGTDTSLPLLFGTESLTNLTSARGLFSGCRNLTGSVPEGFLSSLPNLVDVGSGQYLPEFNSSFSATTLAGLFMNTKITSLPSDLFNSNKFLISCSKLVCNTDSNGNIIENAIFDGFTTNTDAEILPQVPLNFFNARLAGAEPTLKNIEYAFAGCTKIKTIQSSVETDPEDLSLLPKSLENARGAFMLSGIESIPSNLFKATLLHL